MSSPPPAIGFSTSSMNKPNRTARMRHATYEGCRNERGRGQRFGSKQTGPGLFNQDIADLEGWERAGRIFVIIF